MYNLFAAWAKYNHNREPLFGNQFLLDSIDLHIGGKKYFNIQVKKGQIKYNNNP